MKKRYFVVILIFVLVLVVEMVLVGFFKIGMTGKVISSAVSCEDGVMAYYDFEDDVGEFLGGKAGSVYGASFVDGKFGKAISFDGADDYAVIPRAAKIEPLGPVTLAVWIYLEQGDDIFAVIFDKPYTEHKNPFHDYHLRFDYANGISPRLSASFVTGDGYSPSDTLLLSKQRNLQGSWNHVVLMFDGKVMKLFINGEFKKIKENTGDIVYHDTDLYLGSYKNLATGHLKGKIDEFVIYDKVFSNGEVTKLYNREEAEAICEVIEIDSGGVDGGDEGNEVGADDGVGGGDDSGVVVGGEELGLWQKIINWFKSFSE